MRAEIPQAPSGKPEAAQKNNSYMPYLDGLRAIALFAVLVSHFAYDRNIPDMGTHPCGSATASVAHPDAAWLVSIFFAS